MKDMEEGPVMIMIMIVVMISIMHVVEDLYCGRHSLKDFIDPST